MAAVTAIAVVAAATAASGSGVVDAVIAIATEWNIIVQCDEQRSVSIVHAL